MQLVDFWEGVVRGLTGQEQNPSKATGSLNLRIALLFLFVYYFRPTSVLMYAYHEFHRVWFRAPKPAPDRDAVSL